MLLFLRSYFESGQHALDVDGIAVSLLGGPGGAHDSSESAVWTIDLEVGSTTVLLMVMLSYKAVHGLAVNDGGCK